MMAPSKANWLKGVLGLRKLTYALILFLEDYFTQASVEWSNSDTHLQHLLDQGAKGELKQTKKQGQYWDVHCTDCKPLLEELVNCHRQPNRLMWNNNEDQTVTASDAYRMAKLFMSNGNADSHNLRDRDPLAVLEVCRNEKCLGFTDTAFVLILFRNRLMHSCDNCITEEELTGAFDAMKTLLRNDKLKAREECKTAVTELNELLKKPMLCEIDESNELWKMAISIKEMAMKNEGMVSLEVSLEDLKKLLEDTKSRLLAEENQRQNAESSLANSKRDLQESTRKEQHEKQLAEQTKRELENQGSQKQNLQKAYENLQEENRQLQEEINKLKDKSPSLSKRIASGATTGTGVGFIGGPIGAAVGGASGAVVGGASYMWDKYGW